MVKSSTRWKNIQLYKFTIKYRLIWFFEYSQAYFEGNFKYTVVQFVSSNDLSQKLTGFSEVNFFRRIQIHEHKQYV